MAQPMITPTMPCDW